MAGGTVTDTAKVKPISSKPHYYSYNTDDCAMTKKNGSPEPCRKLCANCKTLKGK